MKCQLFLAIGAAYATSVVGGAEMKAKKSLKLVAQPFRCSRGLYVITLNQMNIDGTRKMAVCQSSAMEIGQFKILSCFDGHFNLRLKVFLET